MTRQSRFVTSYHCIDCLRNNINYKQFLSSNSKVSAQKIPQLKRSETAKLAASKIPYNIKSSRAKLMWTRPGFKEKYRKPKTATEKLKISETMKSKFKSDQSYIEKIKAARKNYWANRQYRDNRILSLEQFIKRAKSVHGDKYDYSLVAIKQPARSTKIDIICKEHGVFKQRPLWHIIYANGCPKCKTLVSKPHQDIIDFIKLHYNGQIIINDRALIGFELDIVLPDLKLAIEFNGSWYHSHNNTKHLSKHLHYIKATKACKIGYKLIQIFEYDWIIPVKQAIIKGILLNKLLKSTKIHARKCKIAIVSPTECDEFLNQNHLYGKKRATIAYGLYNNNELISIMSFQKHITHWEIARLATKVGIVIVGGASKIFRHFIKHHSPNEVKTYADRSISLGDVYTQLGFKCIGITKPGYKYFKANRVYPRQKFQKHKLYKMLPKFDPSKTEFENMISSGYRIIWDSGHLKFTWKQQ